MIHYNFRHQKVISYLVKSTFLYLLISLTPFLSAQPTAGIRVLSPGNTFKPMEKILVVCPQPGELRVKDSKGREYFRSRAETTMSIPVTGATGTHTVLLMNSKGIAVDSAKFSVATETSIDDGGKTGEMFRLFHKGMLVYDPDGVSEITWNGKTYRYFVEWVLDNNNTMKGMQYFSPFGARPG